MSLLFADVYDGIRSIRIQKGVCEKDILNYVQDKVGGCMKVGNVLKTIRTLKKLCEEGVLIKKGNRYMFAPKCGKPKEEEEGDDENDECNEDDDMDMEPDECDESGDEDEDDEEEEEEEEEEEDDDDEEEEEDDDDDDDDDCDEKDQAPGGEECDTGSQDQKGVSRTPVKSNENFLENGNGGTPSGGGNGNGGNGNGNNCSEKNINRALVAEDHCGKKSACDKAGKKEKSVVSQDGEGKKGSEAIAFCVRDFIDSLGRPHSTEKKDSRIPSEEILQENMDMARNLELAKTLAPRKRSLKTKRKTARQNSYRSRSPHKGGQSEMYHSLGQDHSDDTGFRAVSSEFFQEPGDVDMEVEEKSGAGFEGFRMPEPLPSVEPLNGLDPLCVEPGIKAVENVKMEQSFENLAETVEKKASQGLQMPTTNCQMTQMTWYPLEDNDKEHEEPLKRSRSSDDDRNNEKSESLCSVCEKKKRNS